MNITPPTLAGPSTHVGGSTTHGFDDLNSQDFFGMMIAQLQQQDPMKPQDNQQLLNQMSSIRQIQQSSQMTDTLQAQTKAMDAQTKILQNLAGQKFGDPSNLIGLYVQGPGVDDGGEPVDGADGKQTTVEGLVVGVDYTQDGKAILKLHTGDSIVADTVQKVKVVVPDDGSGGTGTTSTDPNNTSAKLRNMLKGVNQPKTMPNFIRGNNAVSGVIDSLLSPGVGMGI